MFGAQGPGLQLRLVAALATTHHGLLSRYQYSHVVLKGGVRTGGGLEF